MVDYKLWHTTYARNKEKMASLYIAEVSADTGYATAELLHQEWKTCGGMGTFTQN